MDHSELINEIISRVAAKLAEGGCPEPSCEPCGACGCKNEKPGLLILTQEHGEPCHAMLESGRLRERYHTDCALLQNDQVDLSAYEVVILYQLTNEVLGKLAGGVCDTPYTRLASQAILMGKRIYIPTEQVELFRYTSTAPAAYYAMMQEKLNLLSASGVTICAQGNLESIILGAPCAPAAPVAEPVPVTPVPEAPCCREGKELRVTKRVLTERDINEASAEKFTCVHISARCILTDLARDCAKDKGIRIERD